MSNFTLAQQPEIIHGDNKDKELLSALRQKLTSMLELLLPPRLLFKHQAWLASVAALIYFGANSLRLQQTVGEEYAYIRQYHRGEHVFLSRKRLLLFVLLEAFGDSLIIKPLVKVIDKWLLSLLDDSEQTITPRPFWRRLLRALARQVGDAQTLFGLIMRIHMAFFFVGGQYYSITKRITGIQYLQAVQVKPHAFSYRRIGLLILFQMLASFSIHLYKAIREAMKQEAFKAVPREIKNPSDNDNERPEPSDAETSLKCGICFDRLAGPAAIPCGHVFCWDCIVKSSQFKAECPSCRHPFETKEITFLGNINV